MSHIPLSEIVHWALHIGEIAGIFFFARDVAKLSDHVCAVDLGEEQIVREEHKLESQDEQLRADVDKLQAAVSFLRKAHRDRDPMTDWSDDRPHCETLEGAFAPPSQPGDTQVFSPNAPRLPSFSLSSIDRDTIIDQLWSPSEEENVYNEYYRKACGGD